MSVEQTRATMQAYLDMLVARGDFEQYFSDDVRWTTAGYGGEITGRDAVGSFIRMFHTQAFDAAPEIRNVFVADGKAALEATFVGQHIAEFMGIAATQRHVEIPYAVIYDLSGNKITALRAYFPMDRLLQQLGGTPESARATA